MPDPVPPPVLPITSTYTVTAEILVNWDTPPRITHPFAPTNGSLDASVSGVKFTTTETQTDAEGSTISTNTYSSTRTRPIGGQFLYTIDGEYRRDSSLNGIELSATQDKDGTFHGNGHSVSAVFTPDPDEIDISAEVLTPEQIKKGQSYTVLLPEVSVDKYIQVYKGDPRLRWNPPKTYFYIMGAVEYSQNAYTEKGVGTIEYFPSDLVQKIGVRNETSVEARFKSGNGNYWSWDDAGVSSESQWGYGSASNPAKCTVTFTTF